MINVATNNQDEGFYLSNTVVTGINLEVVLCILMYADCILEFNDLNFGIGKTVWPEVFTGSNCRVLNILAIGKGFSK